MKFSGIAILTGLVLLSASCGKKNENVETKIDEKSKIEDQSSPQAEFIKGLIPDTILQVKDSKGQLYMTQGVKYGKNGLEDGVKHGKQVIYQLEEKPQIEAYWNNDTAVGSSTEWYANGKIKQKIEYDNHGEAISVKLWDETGKEIPLQ